jgi:3-oxoacyl-(acyl-carrier-protein) synthase
MLKPLTGETFGASGPMALATAAMMMDRNEIVGTGLPVDLFTEPTAGSSVSISEKTVASAGPLRNVLVNSLHAGGNTTSIVLGAAA